MILETQYNFGDIVYLKTDSDQKERMITGFKLRPAGTLIIVQCGTYETEHYEIELTSEKNVLITTTN